MPEVTCLRPNFGGLPAPILPNLRRNQSVRLRNSLFNSRSKVLENAIASLLSAGELAYLMRGINAPIPHAATCVACEWRILRARAFFSITSTLSKRDRGVNHPVLPRRSDVEC